MAITVVALAAAATSIAGGALAALYVHRRTRLSPRNLYLLWAFLAALVVVAVGSRQLASAAAALLALLFATAAAVTARRWHLSALGAGGELRDFERSRVMVWSARRAAGEGRSGGERVWIAGQGELMRKRDWPESVRALPMTGDGRALVSLQEGHHQLFVGATGSGKTTSARRVLLARGLGEPNVAVLALDPKGDTGLEHDLRAIAAKTGRPFVLFDPYDERTDRWNPIWADDPGAVVARLVAPVEADANSDASHYSRLLRVHLGLVCEALASAERWPLALPVLLRVAQRPRFARLVTLTQSCSTDRDLLGRLTDHHIALGERSTQAQLDGSLRALEVVAGQAWRRVLTPTDTGAVALPDAMAAGAIVLWKTHVEDIKEEAETITTLALADIGAAARTLRTDAQWVLLLDEFGSVLQGRAGARAVALMQRARSSHGQVLVSTQSISDIPSATGNEHLLGALTDNFTSFVAHRQTSPESRDWLAKLFGTREIWQSTDRTMGGRVDGTGSRRRAAEFIVRPDEFRQLGPGEAFIATTLGPPPTKALVTPGPRLQARNVLGTSALYRAVGMPAPEELLEPTREEAGSDPTEETVDHRMGARQNGMQTANGLTAQGNEIGRVRPTTLPGRTTFTG